MRRYQRAAVPETISIETAPVRALVYFMPHSGGRRASFSEFCLVREAIEQNAFREENWDGNCALPIGEDVKQNAIRGMMNVLLQAPVPDVSPNPNGTLSFEWQSDNGSAHLEIGRTKFSFYVNLGAGSTVLLGGTIDEINQFYGTVVARLLFPEVAEAPAVTTIRYFTNV